MNSAPDQVPLSHGSLSSVLQVRILAASGLPEVWKLSMGTSENMIAYIIQVERADSWIGSIVWAEGPPQIVNNIIEGRNQYVHYTGIDCFYQIQHADQIMDATQRRRGKGSHHMAEPTPPKDERSFTQGLQDLAQGNGMHTSIWRQKLHPTRRMVEG